MLCALKRAVTFSNASSFTQYGADDEESQAVDVNRGNTESKLTLHIFNQIYNTYFMPIYCFVTIFM